MAILFPTLQPSQSSHPLFCSVSEALNYVIQMSYLGLIIQQLLILSTLIS